MRLEEEGEVKGRTNTSRGKIRRIKIRECRERKEETERTAMSAGRPVYNKAAGRG